MADGSRVSRRRRRIHRRPAAARRAPGTRASAPVRELRHRHVHTTCPPARGTAITSGLLPMRGELAPQGGRFGNVLVQQRPTHSRSAACQPYVPPRNPVVGVGQRQRSRCVRARQNDGGRPSPRARSTHRRRGGRPTARGRRAPTRAPPVRCTSTTPDRIIVISRGKRLSPCEATPSRLDSAISRAPQPGALVVSRSWRAHGAAHRGARRKETADERARHGRRHATWTGVGTLFGLPVDGAFRN